MSPVQEKFELIMRQIGEFLAPEGFRRSQRCFRKTLTEAGIRWSVCSQKSRHSTADSIDFTFNVSAEWKRRPADWEDWQPRTTWYGAAGDRIGFYSPAREDTWWSIGPGTSAEFLSDQINAVLSSGVLPFLKQFQTEQSIKDYYRACEKGTMRMNYSHAITMLELDLLDKKEQSEIERRIKKIRFLGKLNSVSKEVTEGKLQRVLKVYGYDAPLPGTGPWWKLWG